jgi:hypothetical protein
VIRGAREPLFHGVILARCQFGIEVRHIGRHVSA